MRKTQQPEEIFGDSAMQAAANEIAARQNSAEEDAVAKAMEVLETLEATPAVTPRVEASIDDYAKAQAAARKRLEATERELLIAQMTKDRERREAMAQALKNGQRIIPTRAHSMDAEPSADTPFDSDGRPAGRPDTLKRLAKLSDHEDRQTGQYVSQWAAIGYKVVKDRLTGRPIANQLGLLMEIEPDLLAKFKAAKAARTVSENEFPGADGRKGLQSIIDHANRAVGASTFKLFEAPGHNTE